MKSSTHARNAAIAALVVLLIFLSATPFAVGPAQAQGNSLTLVSSSPSVIDPGNTGVFRFRLVNDSGVNRTFDLSISGLTSGITGAFPGGTQVTVASGPTNGIEFEITITVPTTVAQGSRFNFTLSAISTSPSTLTVSTPFAVQISGSTVTPTSTNTATAAPATATPTDGPVCADGFEPDNSPGAAKEINVQTSQLRTICGIGDEDWVVFGGVGGKVYTIDISRMDPGIDLTLELFDPNLNSIAFNDDFFNRDPANPNPADTRPRITIRIPFDGPYYIRVRDAAGRGGINFFYVIALIDESYGPTPTLVREVCLDLFEPDGLPEQARLITSNELQENRALCPDGDADWVVFFAKTGKRYVIFTDTRRYRGRNVVNGVTQAGADTVIVLTDRDGVSVLDVNDDIPGGSTLDSQIEFIPDVDGFYFVQIKNVGDIGNQFIRYDLTLLLCVPGQTTCGRPSGDPAQSQPADPRTPLPTATPADEFFLEPTNTPQPTPTPTNTPVP